MILCQQCGIGQSDSIDFCSICGSDLSVSTAVINSATPQKNNSEQLQDWESGKGSLFGRLFRTIKDVSITPDKFFKSVNNDSSLGKAVLFYLVVIMVTVPVQLLFDFAWETMTGTSGNISTETNFIIYFLIAPIFVFASMAIALPLNTAWNHFLLFITRSRKASFKESMIAQSYSQAPYILLLFPIPFLMPMIVSIWMYVAKIFAFAGVHKQSKLRIFLVFFISDAIVTTFWILLFIFAIVMIIMIAAAAGSMEYGSFNIQDLLDMYR